MSQITWKFNKTHLLLFSIILIGFLVISAVNASELTNETNLSNVVEQDAIAENDIPSFENLSEKINETSENGVLTLESDYEFKNGTDKQILISKSITIDGNGHTLDGKKSSRIFSISADNVVLKNIRFINGKFNVVYGNEADFISIYFGGGAIFWKGNGGCLENCTFENNSATVTFNSSEQATEVICDGETMIIVPAPANVGRTMTNGGAIAWTGENGSITNCIFKENNVDYPNNGGAIYWFGKSGKIIDSEFYYNLAFRGSAIYWAGTNGTVLSSIFYNYGLNNDKGIYWIGENGTVKNCILLGDSSTRAIYTDTNLKADYNFWGDTLENPNSVEKISGINNWILIKLTSSKDIAFKGEEYTVSYDLTTLMDKNSKTSIYTGLKNNSGIIKKTADENTLIEVSFDNQIKIKLYPFGYFDELSQKIIDTPENGVLVLDKDYEYKNGSNKGILITKPITIDGAGHTLDGKELSRIFNITSDNVTLKNINFVNGNAFGRYFSNDVGGGAIYWNGANGLAENCNFTNNAGRGIEDDPFDKEETYVDENGIVWHTYRMRPMGAKVNEGGAIVWNGTNGTVLGCTFIRNTVGYPNTGGAIYWRGDNGKVIDSKFFKNDAWCGSAIAWIGDNGIVSHSIIANSSFFDGGIYWFGDNGTIEYSILLTSGRASLRPEMAKVKADYNFWGDTLEDPNLYAKISSVNNWFVMNITHNGEFIKKGQTVDIICEITDLYNKNGTVTSNDAFYDYRFELTYTAPKTGYLNITFINGEIKVSIDSKDKIKSKNVKTYYKKNIPFKVHVSDVEGDVINKYVKFKVNKKTYNVLTDSNGIASLKLKLKPGKYTVYTYYGNLKVKNTITVKTVLITKNLKKKVKKLAKFKVKVLNSKGKAFSKQLVKIKFKGKTYKIKTNKKGIATFKIPKKLKVGKYTIKTTYNGITNSNKVIVKK